ncbi:MAG: helix-turn-helix transcriptional regulator [Eggerthellaceae bacterium]|nr:helix-turn-helix transcriptional regulator [Eggerthellaceae bacterium]
MRDTRFPSLLTVFGFACFWSGMITAMTSPVFAPTSIGHSEGLLVRFLFLIGFAIVQFFSYTKILNRASEERLQRIIRAAFALLAFLFPALALVASLGALGSCPVAVIAVGWLLFGASCGLLLVAWGITWTQLDAERPDSHASALGVAASIILSAVLSVFMLFSPQAVSIIAVMVLLYASLFLQMYLKRQFASIEDIDVKASRQRLDLFSRNLLTPLFVGASFGAVLVFAASRVLDLSLFVPALMGIALGSASVFVVLFILKRVPRYSTFERFIFPILGGGLLLLPFTDGVVFLVVAVIVFADVISFFIMHWTVLIMLSYRHHVRASFHYEQGLISPLCGVALGWGAVSLLVFVPWWPQPETMLAVSLVLVFLLVLILSIVPYASNKTAEEIAGTIEEEIQDKTGSWRRHGEKICKEYLLTPREKEVFLLLAKGRNTEVIAKRLFISTHTAKTHTARIYRKLSINSQQELIDMIETGT